MTRPRLELLRYLAGTGRLEILAYLLEQPAAAQSINGIARENGVPLGTTWRAVHELADLGLLLLDRVGSVTIVRPNMGSPLLPRLRELLALDLPTPHALAYEYFARRVREELPGVNVYLFGSVRAGTAKPSSDVDIEVVYGKTAYKKEAVARVCDRVAIEALDRFRVPVTPLVLEKKMTVTAP